MERLIGFGFEVLIGGLVVWHGWFYAPDEKTATRYAETWAKKHYQDHEVRKEEEDGADG